MEDIGIYTELIDKKPFDCNNQDELMRQIYEFAETHKDMPVEYAKVFSTDGYVYTLRGEATRVNPSMLGEQKLKGGIMIHNHPIGYDDSFSEDDFWFANNRQMGKQYLVSGNRRNAFEFKEYYTDMQISDAWRDAFLAIGEKAQREGVEIVYRQEEIMKALNVHLKGFEFYENF